MLFPRTHSPVIPATLFTTGCQDEQTFCVTQLRFSRLVVFKYRCCPPAKILHNYYPHLINSTSATEKLKTSIIWKSFLWDSDKTICRALWLIVVENSPTVISERIAFLWCRLLCGKNVLMLALHVAPARMHVREPATGTAGWLKVPTVKNPRDTSALLHFHCNQST